MVDKKEVSRPIFVVGTSRSGTTLTASIIGNHSNIFMPAETHFFDDIYSRRQELGDPADPATMRRISTRLTTIYRRQHEGYYQRQNPGLFKDADQIAQMMGPCNNYRDVLSRFIGMQMEIAGKVRWGNQVPRDIFNVSEILEFYPDAKFVVCVRDLRDFLLSYGSMQKVVPAKHVARQKSLYHPVVTALLWRATMRLIPVLRRRIDPANLAIVRYEDLVSDPEGVTRNICTMIGEDFEPEMLAVRHSNSSAPPTADTPTGIYNSPVGSAPDPAKTPIGVFKSSVGRWRNELPNEHAYIGQKIAGKELHNLGYENESLSVNPLKIVLIVLMSPIALVRGLYANRAKQAALLPYLAKRLGALLRNPS